MFRIALYYFKSDAQRFKAQTYSKSGKNLLRLPLTSKTVNEPEQNNTFEDTTPKTYQLRLQLKGEIELLYWSCVRNSYLSDVSYH